MLLKMNILKILECRVFGFNKIDNLLSIKKDKNIIS
jgi:hypothetical protein